MTFSQPSKRQSAADWYNDKGDGQYSFFGNVCEWMAKNHNVTAFQHPTPHHQEPKAAQRCSTWMKVQGCPIERDAKGIIEKASWSQLPV